MYRTAETNSRGVKDSVKGGVLKASDKESSKLEALLTLTETVATLTIGAGVLLLVAACLSTL